MQWTLYPVSDFSQFKEKWDSLNRIHGNSPLLDSAFVMPLLTYFTTGAELIALYGDVKDPDIITVLHSPKKNIWETLQPSNAPLGLWMSRTGNLSSQRIRSLIKILPGHALSLAVTQQDPLNVPRPKKNDGIDTIDYIETAHIDFPDSFDEYWASRSKNLRHNMKRQKNYLKKNEVIPQLECWTTPSQMSLGVSDYATLESSGWKGDIDSAVAEGDAQSQFYSDMLTNFCSTNEALILRYYYNDDLVATDLCLLRNDVLYILKTTYDEAVKSTSPAHIMRFDYYQQALANETLRRVEFYGPLKDWHTKWTNDVRALYHANIYRNSLIALVRRMAKRIT